MTPSSPQFFELSLQGNLSDFADEVRTQLLPVLIEQETQAIALRFTRAFDAALFDTQHPLEDIDVFDSMDLEQLIVQTISSANSEQRALLAMDSAFLDEFDPFGFTLRGKFVPSGMLLEVTSSSPSLLRGFAALPRVTHVADKDLDESLVFKGAHDWSMRLTSSSDLTVTSTNLSTLIPLAPPLAQRAAELSRLLVAEGSRDILARMPNGRIAGAIGQVSVANPTSLADVLEVTLPPLPGLTGNLTISQAKDLISHSQRVAINRAIERSLADIF